MESIYTGKGNPGPLDKRQRGQQMELLARHYLENAKLIWIASNSRFRQGEIDLIMLDGDCLVFIEVRYRQHQQFGGAVASVDWRKRQRLLQAAAYWLAERQQSLETTCCRFDIVAITGNQIQWLKNAFNAD